MDTYEEKYKEIVGQIRKAYLYAQTDSTKAVLEEIFPELKENEDEKILVIIKHCIECRYRKTSTIQGISMEQCFAWLEKQGGHANFRNKIQVGDKVTRNEAGVLVNLSQLKRVAKPADKVELKFKVGDWIINPETRNVLQIKNVLLCGNKGNYEFDNSSMPIESVDRYYKQWTIKDAKDGDVLKLGEVTAIFQKYIGDGNCKCYCSVYEGEFEIPTQYNSYGCHNAIPATKEQRDLLFQKMQENGYMWDAENKAVTKIEKKFTEFEQGLFDMLTDISKPCTADCVKSHSEKLFSIARKMIALEQKREWSKKDEIGLGDALWAIKQAMTIAKDENDMGNLWYAEKWLKSLKDRVQPKQEWSEEDNYLLNETIKHLEALIRIEKKGIDCDSQYYQRDIDWLKSIKGRVLLKQGWSEEDEDNFKHLLDEIVCLGNNRNSANRLYYDRLIKFIEELKNRAQPKEKWCDKDERMLDRLIAYFEKQVALTDDDNPRYANWLKSLRPQNRWKPSDEQMESLDWQLLNTTEGSWAYKATKELIEDLKKLKEV